MDKKTLYEKRENLKRKREVEDRLSLIEDLTNFLDDKGIPHGISFDDSSSNWISENFPLNFSGIDWEKTVGSSKLDYANSYQRNKIISKAISENLSPDDLVTVAWTNALRPSIEIRAETISKYPAVFADEDFDTWVIHFELKFCLECYHEGYVGYTMNS